MLSPEMASVRSFGNFSLRRLADYSIRLLSFVVFAIFDLVDQLLCPVFAFLDWHLDRHEAPCYCHQTPSSSIVDKKEQLNLLKNAELAAGCEFWSGPSDTLYGRKHKQGRNRVHFLALHRTLSVDAVESPKDLRGKSGRRISSERFELGSFISDDKSSRKPLLNAGSESELSSLLLSSEVVTESAVPQECKNESAVVKARWSDCGCSTCTAWQANGDLLHVHVDGKDLAGSDGLSGSPDSTENNVIFIHGFLSSSSFWADTVVPHLPASIRSSHRLFAVDLLGFGKSPKPVDCQYSNADHVYMIRRSVIERYGLQKYHVVAHSMGCTIALSLAGHDPSALKSITLISPPYFPATPGFQPSSYLLRQVAPKRVWPLLELGPSVMSWYEHLGRVVCLVICKNHRLWEPIFAFTCTKVLRLRIPLSFFHDFMQHTHNSAWHSFHNTICSGAYTTECCMRILQTGGQRVKLIHGDNDPICPLQCSLALSQRFSNVSLTVVPGANHLTAVLGRERDLALELGQEILRASG